MPHPPAPSLPASLPRWLRPVMIADRTLSAWFVGCGFGFAPLLLALTHAPWATALAVTAIAVAGLWLGLLGIGMAWGLAQVLRAGDELPHQYWASIIEMPPPAAGSDGGRR
ncbi:hypothetical protein [Williamsia serinedens]|uniref:Uncharacterized protein n=1 Tax=Williamsia serinedens TaxID=391736 RepID=A0ABT1H9E4_9NOCA|nr:hypothetical protein [Williamsia serinedens]MCP2162428.1 hypothetical protein [Williamsia serinedens]